MAFFKYFAQQILLHFRQIVGSHRNKFKISFSVTSAPCIFDFIVEHKKTCSVDKITFLSLFFYYPNFHYKSINWTNFDFSLKNSLEQTLYMEHKNVEKSHRIKIDQIYFYSLVPPTFELDGSNVPRPWAPEAHRPLLREHGEVVLHIEDTGGQPQHWQGTAGQWLLSRGSGTVGLKDITFPFLQLKAVSA